MWENLTYEVTKLSRDGSYYYGQIYGIGGARLPLINVKFNNQIYLNIPNTYSSSGSVGYYGDQTFQNYPFFLASDGDMGGTYLELRVPNEGTYEVSVYLAVPTTPGA